MKSIILRYFDGCPNWKVALERIHEAIERAEVSDVRIDLKRVETAAEAEAVHFRGSPSVLIDGQDPFVRDGDPVGLSCRMFVTEDGPQGASSVSQLSDALQRASCPVPDRSCCTPRPTVRGLEELMTVTGGCRCL